MMMLCETLYHGSACRLCELACTQTMDIAAEGREEQIRQRENEDEGFVKKIQN